MSKNILTGTTTFTNIIIYQPIIWWYLQGICWSTKKCFNRKLFKTK